MGKMKSTNVYIYALIYFIICVVGSITMFAQSPPIPGNWQLTFEDNFDGDYLEPTKWRVGQHFLGINGIDESGNSADQVNIQNGMLEITAEKRNFVYAGENRLYATSEVTTYQEFRQLYGYFEARIKYDAKIGAWPAFWTMPDRGGYGDGPKSHESYVKFNISSLTSSVSSAELKIKVTGTVPEGTSDVSIHRLLSNNWDESNITWNNKPEFDPAWFALFTGTDDVGKINEITQGEFLTIDVTEYINSQITTNDDDAGFALVDIFMKDRQLEFGSKEATNEIDRPRLIIDGSTLYPTDDAYVRDGSFYANNNYGTEQVLIVKDPWVSTSKIDDGGMEIDIMESLGVWGDNKTQHALHWDYYGPGHPHAGSGTLTLTPTGDGYHVYAMNWQPGRIDFYLDDELSWTYEDSRVGSVESYILLSHQLGGWDGNDNFNDATMPFHMYVDYVRVYKDVPPLLIQTKIFLEGSYDPSSDMMNADLNIPETSPYDENVRTITIPNADIVDWVLVQLRSTENGPAVVSKSVLLHKDGRIVADDGTTGVIELDSPEGEGSYHLVIKHRNHLAIMSKDPVPLNNSSSSLYDFTSGSEMYYGTNGAKQLE